MVQHDNEACAHGGIGGGAGVRRARMEELAGDLE